jgi:ribosomal-protein-alanine N-acetyltransferase
MDVAIDLTGVFIETERLVLRGWRADDLADLYVYASVDGVGEMAGWRRHQSLDESRKILDLFMAERDVLALEHKRDRKVIGSIGLHVSWANEEDAYRHLRVREVGYVLARDYWGQGLMPEAVRALVGYGFGPLDLEALTCGHFVSNSQSRRVIEKCGFRFVKHSTFFARQLQQEIADMKYILLRSDWELGGKSDEARHPAGDARGCRGA